MSAPARTTACDRGWTICFGPSELLERLFGLRREQALRCVARLCHRSPLERRQIQRAGAWLGADEDGWPFSPRRSSSRLRHQAWLATSEDELARSTGGYFYHQRPRAPDCERCQHPGGAARRVRPHLRYSSNQLISALRLIANAPEPARFLRRPVKEVLVG